MPVTRRLAALALYVPVALIVPTVAAVAATTGVHLGPPGGVRDIDVAVVDAADRPLWLPALRVPIGTLEVADVDSQQFRFSGWADLRTGASFVLRTAAAAAAPRIRARSLPRPDVAAALDRPDLLYSGYAFAGTSADWGQPTCLDLVDKVTASVLWQAPTARCS